MRFLTIIELKCIKCGTITVGRKKEDGTIEKYRNCPKCGKKGRLEVNKDKK